MQNLTIPPDLLSVDKINEDVTILIGENGSGKSSVLSQLAREYARKQKTVVAVCNSIHDKFHNGGKNIRLLRDRSGRRKTKLAISGALKNVTGNEIQRVRIISQALEFIGYDPVIGFRMEGIPTDVLDEMLRRDDFRATLTIDEIEDIEYLLKRWRSYLQEGIIWLSVTEFSFSEVDRASLIRLFSWEGRLKKFGFIKGIDILLRKKETAIPLFEASSGELSFVSVIIYLAATINENTAILIDEPENSLHPSWQKDYFRFLVGVFHYYQPKVVAATHSALIVTGAEIAIPQTKVYECRQFQFYRKIKEPVNIEEAFVNYFNVVTPENRFLSNYLIEQLNLLASKERSLDAVLTDIDRLQEKSFDPRQNDVLEGIRAMAIKITNSQV